MEDWVGDGAEVVAGDECGGERGKGTDACEDGAAKPESKGETLKKVERRNFAAANADVCPAGAGFGRGRRVRVAVCFPVPRRRSVVTLINEIGETKGL